MREPDLSTGIAKTQPSRRGQGPPHARSRSLPMNPRFRQRVNLIARMSVGRELRYLTPYAVWHCFLCVRYPQCESMERRRLCRSVTPPTEIHQIQHSQPDFTDFRQTRRHCAPCLRRGLRRNGRSQIKETPPMRWFCSKSFSCTPETFRNRAHCLSDKRQTNASDCVQSV